MMKNRLDKINGILNVGEERLVNLKTQQWTLHKKQ